jgi:hypothetical protein
MKIGSVNSSMFLYVLAYDTGHGDEVEFLDLNLFNTAEEAQEYFDEIYKKEQFINPRPIPVFVQFSTLQKVSKRNIVK